jgi:predicted metallopeptidase
VNRVFAISARFRMRMLDDRISIIVSSMISRPADCVSRAGSLPPHSSLADHRQVGRVQHRQHASKPRCLIALGRAQIDHRRPDSQFARVAQ